MRMMITKRFLIRAVTVVLSLPLIYFAAALIGAMIPGERADLPGGTENLIGLLRGPIHFDFLLPLSPDLRARYGFAEAAGVPVSNPQAEWLVLGWGAQEFYTTAGSFGEITASAVFSGITGDASVIHLDVAGDVSGLEGISYLTLSDPQIAALLATIDDSFQRDQTGQPVALPARFGPRDAFFAANGKFHLFHTCNAWVGETLRAAGIPFGVWTPTPQSVAYALGRVSVN